MKRGTTIDTRQLPSVGIESPRSTGIFLQLNHAQRDAFHEAIARANGGRGEYAREEALALICKEWLQMKGVCS